MKQQHPGKVADLDRKRTWTSSLELRSDQPMSVVTIGNIAAMKMCIRQAAPEASYTKLT